MGFARCDADPAAGPRWLDMGDFPAVGGKGTGSYCCCHAELSTGITPEDSIPEPGPGASISPGWLGMPHKGYRPNWDSGEECKDKELCNLYTAHFYRSSGGCRGQPPAFAPVTSVATASCPTGFTLSLFKSAGL